MIIAYESYCFELKRQLEICQAENHELRKKLSSATSEPCDVRPPPNQNGSDDSASLEDINSLLKSMTCLSIKVLSSGAEEKHYQCQILDGTLKGNNTTNRLLMLFLYFFVFHRCAL